MDKKTSTTLKSLQGQIVGLAKRLDVLEKRAKSIVEKVGDKIGASGGNVVRIVIAALACGVLMLSLVGRMHATLATTTTYDLEPRKTERISTNLYIMTGSIDVTTTEAAGEVTDITNFFRKVLVVIFEAADDLYKLMWDSTNESIVAYQLYVSDSIYKAAGSIYGTQADGDLTWIALGDGLDVGAAEFIAIGMH